MGCFDNYIALKGGCDNPTIDSGGFYINNIGINREFIENSISSDAENVDEFFYEQVKLAVAHLKSDVFKSISGKFNTKSIIEGQRIGFYQDNMILNAAIPATMKGLQLQSFDNTSFLKLFISKIELQVDFTGDVDVEVYDLKQNKLLDTLTVTCVAGEVSSLIVNKVYHTEMEWTNIAFLYDASAFGSYRSSTVSSGCLGCYKSYPFQLNKYILGSGVTILSADDKIQSNIDGTSDTGGLSVFYSLQCSQEDWLCTNANILAPALLYKTAYLLTENARYYTRQNNSLIFDAEKLSERMEMYDFEYNKNLTAVLQNLRIPTDSVCFFCAKARMIKAVLPG